MAAPVWSLTVDLQTKTATFQTGMADAAKSARGAFGDIGSGAKEMGGTTSFSMMEARHSVMMLGEEFGVRMPRALAGFVAGLGPVGPALEAAFPFLAIIGLAVLFMEHLNKLHENAEKLAGDHADLEHTAAHTYDTLVGKLREAEEKTAELNKDYLTATKLKIQDIDAATLNSIQAAFQELDSRVKKVLEDSKAAWYTFQFGAGEAGKAWQEFQEKFQIARDANDLKGMHTATDEFKKEVSDRIATLAGLHDAEAKQSVFDAIKAGGPDAAGALASVLTHLGVMRSTTSGIITQWQDLLHAVNDVNRDMAVAEKTGGIQKANVKTEADNSAADDAKKQAEELARGKEVIARLISEQYKQQLEETQAGEKEVIAATREGGQDRLNAIDAAIMEEEALGLQETSFYRSLWVERIQLVRQMSEEELRTRTAMAEEDSKHRQNMAMLALAADRTGLQLVREMHRASADAQLQDGMELVNREYAIRMQGFRDQLNALDKFGKDYAIQKKRIEDQEKEEEARHDNQITDLKAKAQEDQLRRIKSAEDQERDMFARSFTDMLSGRQSFAQGMLSIGDQLATGMMQNAIKSVLANDFTKESDAAKAARDAFKAAMGFFPPPVNFVMAPLLGAAAFAGVMAFEGGTDRVPGMGRGDVVPAMLTPGEGVVPGGVMDNLRTMSQSGGFDKRPHTTVHVRPTYHVQTIDGDGMRGALQKHSDELTTHVERTLRKLNR